MKLKEYKFTREQLGSLMETVIMSFNEFSNIQDKDEDTARLLAIGEMFEGLDAETFLESISEGKRTMQL